jgi:hypothetical protein
MRSSSIMGQSSRHSPSPTASPEPERTSRSGLKLLGRSTLGILALTLTLLLVTVVVIGGLILLLNLLFTLGLATSGIGE